MQNLKDRQASKMTVLEMTMQVLKNLGGKAYYSDIYEEYEKCCGYTLTVGQKAGIRACIESNSSDSDKFSGKDIFYSVYGKGKGCWGLR